ncbi:hypothetical protein J1P26_07150 [Neobacillus sp. MM2021_6]|uniref:YqgU-like beta propeller domain-containing protein n=1 Tax=Bacillaceae TaxID=186817 RepID=UPI001407EAF7|nr:MULTISPECIES: hypothetical protein [Bacillaceae]MBO0959509.1 hypothetical protein [Neobacillus sp. MM2021_6]NHC17193.1 hypothetical protein [Bacillus sp. MM2020_4]
MNNVEPTHHAKSEKSKAPVSAVEDEWKIPIAIPNGAGEYYKAAGWLSETEIVYITNLEQTSRVFQYNLFTGKSSLIYESKNPIVTVQISPSKKYLLVHSSPSSYEGHVTIIDLKGTEQMEKSFPSYELVFEWNPYNESEILVSKFAEDWSFQLFLLDMNKATNTEVFLRQPFVKWMNGEEEVFLDWDQENPSLSAPLIMKGSKNGNEKTVIQSAIHFSTYRDLLMAVSVNEHDQTMADYSFFDKELKKFFTFSIPQLTKYSDWLVPYFDFNEKKGQFITFRPLKSGEMDTYSDGFQLESYDLKGKSSNLIMEGLDNEPIYFSPSGGALLYGYQFEKIIDLQAKKIYELIQK